MPTDHPTLLLRTGLACLVVLFLAPAGLRAQGALDPSIPPRATMLERQGQRGLAKEMLGRYLATAPDDGIAWFQLGRFYLLDERDWHTRGHVGEPPGDFYLEFASLALDQSSRLLIDSAVVYRLMVDMERARLYAEQYGWNAARDSRPREHSPAIPAYLLELGDNLLSSCPAHGVLLTGSDLEMVTVWYASLEGRHRTDVLPLEPRLYNTDSLYRSQMAAQLGVDPSLPVRQAMAAVDGGRPVCFTPLADTAAVPFARLSAVRMVRVNLPSARPTSDILSVSELNEAERRGGTVWTAEVRAVYAAAARYNSLLCSGLLLSLKDLPLGACGR